MSGRCVGHVYFFFWESKVRILMIQGDKSFIHVEEVFLWGLQSFLITCTSFPLFFCYIFLCVYLPFKFHSQLLPCFGINNITICYNKIQVTCFFILLLVICDSFWWWCTNNGAYNSNACIVIAHDLIRHLSFPFLTKFSWSFSYVIRWLFIIFMDSNEGQLNFIKSKGKTYMKFLYEERLFQSKVCCFSFSLMSQGTLITSKPQFNRKHNGGN